jgi:cell division protein FtsN
MAFGLAIGLIVAAGVYLHDRRLTGTAPQDSAMLDAASPDVGEAPATAASAPPSDTPEEPRFDFYDLLPRAQVVVPELETPTSAPNRMLTITEPGTYVLQAGSFATERDAEAQRARLGLLGIESQIQGVLVDNRQFHRVRIGPLDDLDQVNSIRRRLLDAQVEAFVMRMTEK